MELDLESELLFELRKRNGIKPYRINESSEEELAQIRTFFYDNRHTFYFLFDRRALIGSVLYLRNYVRSLVVSQAYQRKGYGTKLASFAVNRIFDSGYDCVELHTLAGNIAAEQLYKKLGFVEVKP
ncbi:MAG: GNAT family N-acetyltransferase [Spirochaetales bacterium]|nr:GNAT family N-acetyltransferase [Spirochaetales bacterium]